MARCSRKRFDRVKICAGDLRHKADILQRTLLSAGISDTNSNIELKPVKKRVACGIETVSGVQKFNRVNINDAPTHIFTFRYSSGLIGIERQNHFIKFRSRLFRILDIEINNEDKYFIDFSSTERGIDTQLANLA